MKAVVKATQEAMSLEVLDLPMPEVGPNDVLVKIHASGLCYTDSSILKNDYIGRKPVPIPIVLGHEAAGEIVEAGSAVPGNRVGQRVALEPIAGCGHCHQCLMGHPNMCNSWDHIGITCHGTFAEFIAIPSRQAHVIGENVEYAVASMTEPFGLVVRTLEQVNPMIGETAAIIGPGSIGMLHLLALKAAGLGKVIMVGLKKDSKRFEQAMKAGADASIAVDAVDAVEALHELTDGAGADIVVETASSPKATELAFELVAPRGRISLFGLYPRAEFSPVKMVRSGVRAFGDVAQVTRHFVTSSRIMASGIIDFSPAISHRLRLDEAEKAFAATKEGDAVKVVLTP